MSQLAVLAQAREKAKVVIAERAKLHAQAKELPPEPVPVSGEAPPEPEPMSSESEDEEARPKYRYVHGVGYIKIK